MPCIFHDTISGDAMLDKMVHTAEYKKANRMLMDVADIIHRMPIDVACYPSTFFDAWCTTFRHHLRGCSERA